MEKSRLESLWPGHILETKNSMTKKSYSTGTCQRCGKQNVRRLWNLCRWCSKVFEDEYHDKEWSWDPIDELMMNMGYYEKTE